MAQRLNRVATSAEVCERVVRELSERAMLRPAPMKLFCKPYRPDVCTRPAVVALEDGEPPLAFCAPPAARGSGISDLRTRLILKRERENYDIGNE